MTRSQIEPFFKTAALVRGTSIEVRPNFIQKMKLLFSKNFQVRIGGKPVELSFNGKFKAIFNKRFVIRAEGPIIGKGLYENELIELGFAKYTLQRLVKDGTLKKTTTADGKSWRNTYVLLEST